MSANAPARRPRRSGALVAAVILAAAALLWQLQATDATAAVRGAGEVPTTYVSLADGTILGDLGTVPRESLIGLHVAGFPAHDVVSLEIPSIRFIQLLATDGAGAGSSELALPAGLPSGTYRLTATAGRVTSSTRFVLVTAVVPTPTPSTSPSPTPVASTGDTLPVDGTVTSAHIPATGARTLAHTGADPGDLVAAAVLLLGVGALLTLGSRRRPSTADPTSGAQPLAARRA